MQPRSRLTLLALGLGLVVVAGERGRGQSPDGSSLVVLGDFAPPAMERGIIQDDSRAPDSRETLRRRFIRSSFAVERQASSGAAYVGGRVIVKFRDGGPTASHVAALSTVSRSASLAERPPYANFDVVRLDQGEDPEAVANALGQRADVEYAQPAYRVHTQFVPNDPFYRQGLQWNLPLIGLERAWDIQPQAGSSILVAVVDTGIAYMNTTAIANARAFSDEQGTRYPALGRLTLPYVAATQLVGPGRFVAPHDFIWDTETPLDFDGHGTHVAGTIGQLTNDLVGTAGVAFNVKLMPVKVIDSEWDNIFGAPNVGTDDIVARGIRYAAENGAKVINMSIGRTGPKAPVIEDAINYAVGKGAFIAVAAGNDFETGNQTEVIAEIAGRVQGAVSVAAVDRAKAHAYYSSTGPWVELSAPGGSFRAFGAQGGILQQTLDLDLVDTFLLGLARYTAPRFDSLAYFYFTGTSQAAPHVSGVAAMLMQQGVTDPAAVEAALEKFATDLGDAGRDNVFGFGLVDARNTLRGLGLAR